jgi:hypothetical protein
VRSPRYNNNQTAFCRSPYSNLQTTSASKTSPFPFLIFSWCSHLHQSFLRDDLLQAFLKIARSRLRRRLLLDCFTINMKALTSLETSLVTSRYGVIFQKNKFMPQCTQQWRIGSSGTTLLNPNLGMKWVSGQLHNPAALTPGEKFPASTA